MRKLALIVGMVLGAAVGLFASLTDGSRAHRVSRDRHTELKRRFGLTDEVPCAGSDLQGRCKLLGDAREAKALMPSADLQIARLGEQQTAVNGELAAIRADLNVLADMPRLRARLFH